MEFIVVCLVLAVITVVGHLLWLGAAAIFRLLSGSGRAGGHGRMACRMCGQAIGQYPCNVCGYSPGAVSHGADRSAIAYEEVLRLSSEGRIDDQTFAKLREAIYPQGVPQTTSQQASLQQRRGIQAGVASPRPAPQPVPQPAPQPASLPAPLPAPLPIGRPAQERAPWDQVPMADLAPVAEAAGPGVAPIPPAVRIAEPSEQVNQTRTAGAAGSTFRPAAARRTAVPPVPVPAPRPRESLSAFMEKRNIRWGEILSGLVIVGCSVALVITLWSTIAQYALLKFGVFTAVVASLFGLGLYAEHRWKLPTTSRGILVIAMLLVPLQFIAMAAMSAGRGMEGGTILGETVSGAIVLWLAILACRVLTPKWPTTLAVGFVLAAAGVFVIAQNSPAGASSRDVLGLGIPSLLVYLVAAGLVIRSSWKAAAWDSTQGAVMAQGMGLLFYATSAAMIFLLAHFSGAAELWRWASPLLMVLAIPPMAAGMMMSQRLTEVRAVNWRVTGTAIAVAAIGLVALSVLCAWPAAMFFVPMAIVAACVVAGAALVFEMPWAHVPAGLLLGLAGVVGIAWLRGELPAGTPASRVVEVMLGSGTGMVLTAYAVIAGVIAAAMARWKGKPHAMAWGMVAGVAAVLSLAWALFYTYAVADPIRWGAAVFALYTVIAFAAHWRTRRVEAGIAAWVLLLPTLQRLTHNTPHPWVFAFLDVAGLSLLTAIWLRPKDRWWPLSGRLAWRVCFVASICTALLAAVVMGDVNWSQEMLWFGVLAAIVLMATVLEPAGYLLAVGQVALAVAAVSAGLWYGETHAVQSLSAHWVGTEQAAVEVPALVRFGRPVLLSLASAGLAWTLLRIALRRFRGQEPVLLRPALSTDRLITLFALATLLGSLIGLPTLAAAGAELADVRGSTSLFAGVASLATWLTVGLLVIWAVLETWHTRHWGWLVAAGAGVLGACGLVAIYGEPTQCSASVLRWSLMALMIVGSLPLWFRGALTAWTSRFAQFAEWDETATRTLRACLLLPTVLGILALTMIASGLNLAGQHIPGPVAGSAFGRMGSSVSYLVPLGAIIGTLLIHGFRERITGLILSAAAVTHVAVTLGYLLHPDAMSDAVVVVRLMELNAATAAIFALGWIGWEYMRGRGDIPSGVRVLSWVAMLLAAPLIVYGQILLLLNGRSSEMVRLAGLPSAWMGVAGAAAVFWLIAGRRVRLPWLGLVALGCIGLVACAAGHLRVPWLEFHVMLAGYLAAGWFFLLLAERIIEMNTDEARLAGALPMATAAAEDGPRILSYESAPQPSDAVSRGQTERRQRGVRGWIIAFCLVAAVLSLRSLAGDPQRPWWGIGGLFVIDLLAVAIAWKHLRPGYLYPATAAFNLAISIWWAWYQGTLSNHHWLADLLHLNVLCLAGSGGVAMVLERAIFSPELGSGRMWRGRMPALPLQRFAGIVLTFAGVVSAAWVVINHGWLPAHQTMWLTWAATGATLALLVSLFWDKGSRLGLWLLYIAALSAVTMEAGSVGLRGPVVLYLMLLLWFAFSVLCLYLSRNLRLIERLGGEVSADDVRQILGLNSIVLAIAVLGIPLAEVVEWSATGHVASMAGWMIGAYLIIAAFTIYVLILAAVKPVKLALQLSDGLRMGCVYAAEAMVAIAVLHLRLTMPELFGGVFAMYWPLVLMAIAFAGVMASEVCRRRGLRVLAEPLEKTGALLPLLPVLGFSMTASRVDFGLLLLSVGALYGMLATLRKSFGFGLLAVLAVNGALWHLLHGLAGFAFTEHPQLWLIPLAVSVLIAAYLNRRNLPPAQFAMIRMVCLMGVYLSSTADIFINGVAQQPYLPLVLGGLSLAGALAGMWQRVRSMLYLGSGFLLLSIVTVIYHASINLHQTWIIWLVGLACGAGLFAFFAVFEKKRAEVDALIGKLRQWER